MRIFLLTTICLTLISPINADELDRIIFDTSDNKKESKLVKFKIDLNTNNLEIISDTVIKPKKIFSQKNDITFKNEYEQLRFQKEIDSIPINHHFLIHTDQENKVYKISALGNIFAFDVSHTRLHEDNKTHVHNESASFKINSSDVIYNNSILLASKSSKSYSIIDSVIFKNKF